eukprot:Lithocolla_globosa_v1_NODE_8503_length_813_cov_2.150396.p2 type:complete len:104 gc:universal NODE_8503_length_813_cov_2.150396:354-43(-)
MVSIALSRAPSAALARAQRMILNGIGAKAAQRQAPAQARRPTTPTRMRLVPTCSLRAALMLVGRERCLYGLSAADCGRSNRFNRHFLGGNGRLGPRAAKFATY